MFLAGDIGGTKTVLALFAEQSGRPVMVHRQRFASAHYDCLEDVLRLFAGGRRLAVDGVCLGVAGPVSGGRCKTTNLPWTVDARRIAGVLGVRSVALINDVAAIGYGIALLERNALRTIRPGGRGGIGNAAVIAAGTGLGEAAVFWDGRRHHPADSEGGHADFAPRNGLEIELLRYLLAKFPRVSWERVVSGPGLLNIYRFLRDTGRGRQPEWLARKLETGDPAEAISTAALQQKAPLAAAALELFVSLYGAEAGNLALKVKATGGVYVAGGIAPRIMAALRAGAFQKAFLDKGRMRPLMEAIPLRVILDEDCGLYGAAHCAWLKKTKGRLVLPA